jgi:hypothetical protein
MKRSTKIALALFVSLSAFALVQFMEGTGFHRLGEAEAKITQDTVVPDGNNPVLDENDPQIKAVMAVQNRHQHELMAVSEVVGTATGLSDDGAPVVLVLARSNVAPGLMANSLEGIPVVVKITGEISAMKRPSSDSTSSTSNTAALPRPVPIGVSTGNAGECSAGTISARVKDGGNVYALSNNHVYALENAASIGSAVLQPGLYDTQCVMNSSNAIGTLSQFVAINFSGGPNLVDAAIALSSTGLLGNATPSIGYGVPNHVTAAASLGQAVQKYGRTSSLTHGTVSGINATVTVGYGSSGTATFVNQILVSSSKPFIKAGDSGSLLVTNNPNANPVGLLFAGTTSGKLAVANRIDDVLASFGVTIDGK